MSGFRCAVLVANFAGLGLATGEIAAQEGSFEWSGRMDSGDVLEVEGVSAEFRAADVEFRSLSGDFKSDFPLMVRSGGKRWIGSRLRGTIGDGGRHLDLTTVSGDVRLIRR